MTQEEKQLLLKDLCGRLKSNLICKVTHKDSEGWKEENMLLSGIINNEGYFTSENGSVYSSEFKPYLRPMSIMTEEEKEKLQLLHDAICDENYKDGYSPAAWNAIVEWEDYCNSNHLDYRSLIPMGLALEAPEGMYK